MRLLIQRVRSAQVVVEGKEVAAIEKGLLVFVGVGKEDSIADCQRLALKVRNLRIFEDANGKMNLNSTKVQGKVLSVSQFTLYANTHTGNRPGFEDSAPAARAQELWQQLNGFLREQGLAVCEGVFGAHMEIGLVNDGPVTIWLDSKE